MAKNTTKTSKAGKNTTKTPKAQNTVTEAPETQKIEKPAEAPKVERQLKKSLSDSELQGRLAQARTRKGEIVNFLCTKTQDWTIGLIRTARLDKRSGFIQFRIEVLEYPLEEENSADFKDPTGNWLVEGKIECPVRRTNIIWGKGDDSKELRVVGHYSAFPKAKGETPEVPQSDVKPAKKTPKKTTPKVSEEDAAMAAAMADMTAEGLL